MTQRFRIFRGDKEWAPRGSNALGAPSIDEIYDAVRGGAALTTGWGNDLHRAVEEARAYSQSSKRWVDKAISSEVRDTQTGKVYEVNADHPGYREKPRQ